MNIHSSKRKNIYHIASGDLWGGAETQLYHLAMELNNNKNISLKIILMNKGKLADSLKERGIPVKIIDESKYDSIAICFKLRKTFRVDKPHIIHTHGHKENILCSFASLGLKECISLRTVHGALEFQYKSWQIHKSILDYINYFTGNYIQRKIIAVTDDLAMQLRKVFGSHKTQVIENGINIEEVLKKAKEQSNFTPMVNNINIAFGGRLVPVKRLDLLIESIAQLKHHYHKEFHLYIFGEGPLNKNVETLIENLGLDENITLMGEKINIYPYLKQMDLLIMTSDHEGLPMILLESMLLEVPIVAHAVGGITKLLGHGKFGKLVTNHTAIAYRKAILETLTNKEESIKICKLAKKQLLTNYSAKSMTEKYLELYQTLLTT